MYKPLGTLLAGAALIFAFGCGDMDEDFGASGATSKAGKDCYNGCLKKGYDVETCKKTCATKKDKAIKPGCKMYKGCKLCWDKTGKIVKKFCPKQTSETVKPGCKKYQSGGKYCVECWDAHGKTTKKYCK